MIFPIANDSFKIIAHSLLLPDLLSLGQVNRRTRKIANKTLGYHAQKYGYAAHQRITYLGNLKNEFQRAIDAHYLPPALYISNRKRIPFERVLRNFHFSSDKKKIKLLLQPQFFSNEFKLMRELFHSVLPSPKAKFNAATISHIVHSGEKNLLQFLLKAVIHPKSQNIPLHFAAQIGNLASVLFLITQDAEMINKRGLYGATPLCFACGFKEVKLKLSIINHLLLANANPNISTAKNGKGQGRYPLHFAITTKRIEIVELLLRFGADPEVTDTEGMTPLQLAETLNCPNIKNLFIKI